jgi:hypothetical protein
VDNTLFPVPSKKALKKLGYLKDQKGIVNRYLIEDGWKKHVEKTKHFILKSLKNVSFKEIAILGSGWFLDLPIDVLLGKFEKIICFDINHPQQILHKYRNEIKIQFIEGDITGGLIELFYQNKTIQLDEVPTINPIEFDGCFVSLNILSQLDNLLFEYAGLQPENENQIRKKIQEKHVEFLSNYPHLLITDYKEVYRNENGEEIGRKQTGHLDISKNQIAEEWIWEFDTNKTYKDDCLTELHVLAINNLKTE